MKTRNGGAFEDVVLAGISTERVGIENNTHLFANNVLVCTKRVRLPFDTQKVASTENDVVGLYNGTLPQTLPASWRLKPIELPGMGSLSGV
jgi:hypothetical protein